MNIYTVGGAVRDELLGLPVQDRDHVVVGATPEAMERLGYRPVGKDFPVFLHPQTHEEYALARTERKVGQGYKGFTVHAAPDVTLEQDLARRDLTIKAMARDEAGALIDPYGGERDLRARVLRHVGPAFIEDPVRILRVARFAARFDFTLATETLVLMQAMVAGGETDALVAERVWQELSRGLMEASPVRMLKVLAACGLLARLLPELALSFSQPADAQVPQGLQPANAVTIRIAAALEHAAAAGKPLEVRFALFAFALSDRSEAAARNLARRLRASNECRDALLLAALHGEAACAMGPGSPAIDCLALLEAGDAFRRPERLRGLLSACESWAGGEQDYAGATWIEAMRAAAAAVDAGAIAAALASAGNAANLAAQIGAAVREARLAAMKAITHAAGSARIDQAVSHFSAGNGKV